MMGKRGQLSAFTAMLMMCWASQAQQEQEDEPSLEERVAALERQVARLETRFELLRTLASDDEEPAPTAGARIEQLANLLERLTADVRRLERESMNALRAAERAQREAASAQQTARDAASRSR